MHSNQTLRRRLIPAVFLSSLALAAQAGAQTSISGTIFDGNGGPLLAGQVYHSTSSLTIPAGMTLTVEAGAILKLNGDRFTVNGTLSVNGTSGNRAIFTSLFDDTAGGDTNGDGPSAGAPGQWQGVLVGATGSINANEWSARFAGSGGFSPVYGSGGSITVTNSEVRDASGPGFDFNTTAVSPVVSGCSIINNGGRAMQDVNIEDVPGFSNNEASGNGGDYVYLSDTSPAADVLIQVDNLLDDVVVFGTSSTVPSGVTLTLEAGVVLKWSGSSRQTVHGTLRLLGEPGAPVVVTSFDDDDYAGDTNGDGPSNGAPGRWQGNVVGATGNFEAQHAVLRYAGGGGFSPVYSSGGTISVSRTQIFDALGSAVDLNNSNVVPDIRRCVFQGNLGIAVADVTIDAATGFHFNRAMGNGGNYMRLTDTSPLSDVTLSRENTLGDVLVFAATSTIPFGVRVTFDHGVIVKWSGSHRWTVNGTLEFFGVYGDRVVVTSFEDDAHGGDTNADGPSSGTPGSWQGIVVGATGAIDFRQADVAFAGGGGWAPIFQMSGTVVVRDCIFRDASGAGIDLNGSTVPTRVIRCAVLDNAGRAVTDASLEALTGFEGNVASGNGAGDLIFVSNTSPAVDVSLGIANCLNRTLVFGTSSTVPNGVSLTLDRGVVIKWSGAGRFTNNGTLNLLGTAFEPVVLTSLDDDDYQGDTNANGATSGLKGQWQGLLFGAGATTSRIENVLLRFTGNGGWSGITCTSPNVELRSVRVEHSSFRGFLVGDLAGDATNWVAFDCNGDGIELNGGSFDLVHATSTANGAFGIQATVSHTGDVLNSIAWGNTTGNFDGYGPGQLLASNGSAAHAGSNGSVNSDPLFIDASAAVGDLRLQAASPSVDTADNATAIAVVKDHDENSRLLDPTLSGVLRADMGAYERALWSMRVFGEARLGTQLRLRITGPAGISTFMLGLLDGSSFATPYGFTTAGTASLVSLGQLPVGVAMRVNVPNAMALIGVEVGLQSLTTLQADPSVGAMTKLYRAKILGPEVTVNFKLAAF